MHPDDVYLPFAYPLTVQNVWNRYDYGRDTHWWKTVGYPLMKSVAEYWIHEMVPDLYSNDGTLVAAPCNSPEHGWTVSIMFNWTVHDNLLT